MQQAVDNPRCNEMKDVLQYHGFNCLVEEVSNICLSQISVPKSTESLVQHFVNFPKIVCHKTMLKFP